ncbi:MAG: hypothetical protein ISR99_02540 [Parcubacteria group bacterium]|nr:hypothetical protein [Parcubacteria group bacterium]
MREETVILFFRTFLNNEGWKFVEVGMSESITIYRQEGIVFEAMSFELNKGSLSMEVHFHIPLRDDNYDDVESFLEDVNKRRGESLFALCQHENGEWLISTAGHWDVLPDETSENLRELVKGCFFYMKRDLSTAFVFSLGGSVSKKGLNGSVQDYMDSLGEGGYDTKYTSVH